MIRDDIQNWIFTNRLGAFPSPGPLNLETNLLTSLAELAQIQTENAEYPEWHCEPSPWKTEQEVFEEGSKNYWSMEIFLETDYNLQLS